MKKYIVIIKTENNIYDGDCIKFYFDNLNDVFNFCKTILSISDYHIEILQCGEDND